MSCDRSAKQFGVGISTAINWVRSVREPAALRPVKMGGHKPKAISGLHLVCLLRLILVFHFTLRALVAVLGARGL